MRSKWSNRRRNTLADTTTTEHMGTRSDDRICHDIVTYRTILFFDSSVGGLEKKSAYIRWNHTKTYLFLSLNARECSLLELLLHFVHKLGRDQASSTRQLGGKLWLHIRLVGVYEGHAILLN